MDISLLRSVSFEWFLQRCAVRNLGPEVNWANLKYGRIFFLYFLNI